MGRVQINFAEVESSFEAIPAGLVPAVCEKVEVRESKSSEHYYLNWEWTITEGEHEGRKLWQITSLSPRALFRLKDQFLALQVIDGDEEEYEMSWDDDVEVTPSSGPLLLEPDVSGMPAVLVVTVETYEGKERNRVDEIRTADSSEAPRAASSSSRSQNSGSAKPKAGARRALR